MRDKVIDNRDTLRPYRDRPVGCPEPPDLAMMSKEELLERRKTLSELRDLTLEAQKGDEESIPALRKILNEGPGLAWLFINLAQIAEYNFIEKMHEGGDLASREALERQLAAMREEVAGEDPSPLERLLAERIVATWLQIQFFEALYGRHMFELTIRQADYHQRRLCQAYRRHLSAIRTLSQVRKLLKPSVAQINIAEQQVNMAGNLPSETSGQVRLRRS